MRKFTDKDKNLLKGDISRVAQSIGYDRVTVSAILHNRKTHLYLPSTIRKISKALNYRLRQNKKFHEQFSIQKEGVNDGI